MLFSNFDGVLMKYLLYWGEAESGRSREVMEGGDGRTFNKESSMWSLLRCGKAPAKQVSVEC